MGGGNREPAVLPPSPPLSPYCSSSSLLYPSLEFVGRRLRRFGCPLCKSLPSSLAFLQRVRGNLTPCVVDVVLPSLPPSLLKSDQTLADSFTKMSADEKKSTIKKTNGIFLLNVKNKAGKEASWTIDLKKDGEVVKGAKGKPGEFV